MIIPFFVLIVKQLRKRSFLPIHAVFFCVIYQGAEKLIFSALIARCKDAPAVFKHVKCLKTGASRNQRFRLTRRKKSTEGLFQQPASVLFWEITEKVFDELPGKGGRRKAGPGT